jgi:ComF family protein
MKPVIHDFLNAFSNLLFPKSCLACSIKLIGNPEILLCDPCLEKIQLIKEPFCSRCGKPFLSAAGENHLCSVCLKTKWHFSKAQAIFVYKEPVTKVIHSFKYHRSTSCLATFYALKSSLAHLKEDTGVDLVIPVPLHKKRLRHRGFNQAQVLASCLFPKQKHKINPHILIRTTDTPLQTNLSGKARRRNLKKAFSVKNPAVVKGKKIMLVDDVFTTGTTLNECARTLRKAGAKDVQALTLARVAD